MRFKWVLWRRRRRRQYKRSKCCNCCYCCSCDKPIFVTFTTIGVRFEGAMAKLAAISAMAKLDLLPDLPKDKPFGKLNKAA